MTESIVGAWALENEPECGSLAIRIALGDTDALGEAYALHHGALRRFARHLVGDPEVAEDLVHDVFLALPSAARRFRGDGTLRGFLFGITARKCRGHVRRAARRRRRRERLAAEPEPELGPTPAETLEARALAKRLARALDDLPIDQRLAFVLVAIDERSGAEAAEILGVPEATVRTRVFRARRKVEHALELKP